MNAVALAVDLIRCGAERRRIASVSASATSPSPVNTSRRRLVEDWAPREDRRRGPGRGYSDSARAPGESSRVRCHARRGQDERRGVRAPRRLERVTLRARRRRRRRCPPLRELPHRVDVHFDDRRFDAVLPQQPGDRPPGRSVADDDGAMTRVAGVRRVRLTSAGVARIQQLSRDADARLPIARCGPIARRATD